MNNTNRGPSPLRFVSPLHRANRQAAIHLEEEIADLGVAAPEAHLLSYVHVYGPCTVGELVRVFGYKKPTMTSMLDRLERKELVHRDLNPGDRRSFVVRASPAGKKLAKEARRRVERFEDALAAKVSDGDRRGFLNIVQAVAEVTGVDVRQPPERRTRRKPKRS